MEETEIHIIYLSIITAILLYFLLSKIANTPQEDTIFGLFTLPNEKKKHTRSRPKYQRKSHAYTYYRERQRLSSSGNDSWFLSDVNVASSSTNFGYPWHSFPATSRSSTDQVVSGQLSYREWSQRRANSQQMLIM